MKSTCYLCDKQVETEKLEIGQYPICDECIQRMEGEDKLDPTANTEAELMEVIRNYGIDIEQLEKKLATAVEALENIKIAAKRLGDEAEYNYASEALEEIGGER